MVFNLNHDDIVCLMRNAGIIDENDANALFTGSLENEANELFLMANDPTYDCLPNNSKASE